MHDWNNYYTQLQEDYILWGATDMPVLVKVLKLTCFKVFHLLHIHYAFFQMTHAHTIFLMNT